jgi:hypothetical protein
MAEAYPLQWPVRVRRSKFRQDAQFKTTIDKARRDLVREVELMGGKSIVISSNIKPRR